MSRPTRCRDPCLTRTAGAGQIQRPNGGSSVRRLGWSPQAVGRSISPTRFVTRPGRDRLTTKHYFVDTTTLAPQRRDIVCIPLAACAVDI